jgi:hypothetical protein
VWKASTLVLLSNLISNFQICVERNCVKCFQSQEANKITYVEVDEIDAVTEEILKAFDTAYFKTDFEPFSIRYVVPDHFDKFDI